MTFEGLTVSVNYGDFLSLTLPENVAQFDRFVVVTSPDDSHTQNICADKRVECVVSERIHHRGAAFNKGALLNDGLVRLSRTGWIAALDADTAVGADFHARAVSHVAVAGKKLFGAKRRICDDYEAWRRYKRDRAIEQLPLSMKDLQNHVRFGPAGVGYLAMFHGRDAAVAERSHPFAEWFSGAQMVDVEFARRWGERREWLPLEVVHLGPISRNWQGRVSPTFLPKAPNAES